MKFYLASPLGFSELGLIALNVLKERLRSIPGVEVHCPWEGDPALSVEGIGSTNYTAIRACDGLIAVLDGSQVDDGTAAEVGFAYGLGKITVGYRGDWRDVGDCAGATVNAQVQYSLTDGVFRSIDELCNVVRGLAS